MNTINMVRARFQGMETRFLTAHIKSKSYIRKIKNLYTLDTRIVINVFKKRLILAKAADFKLKLRLSVH